MNAMWMGIAEQGNEANYIDIPSLNWTVTNDGTVIAAPLISINTLTTTLESWSIAPPITGAIVLIQTLN